MTSCYDGAAALWPLTTAPPTSGGCRLPTEAEWERAAWDGDVIEVRQVAEMSDFPPDVQKAADNPVVKARLEKCGKS